MGDTLARLLFALVLSIPLWLGIALEIAVRKSDRESGRGDFW